MGQPIKPVNAANRAGEKAGRLKVPKNTPTKPVNLKVLSEHLGLSATTVSLVLNNSPVAKGIPEKTKERVITAARELNYKANYFARSLSKKRSYLVGIVTPDLSEGYDAGVLAGIERLLMERNYVYFISNHFLSETLVQRTLQTMVERGAEGLILVNTPIVSHPEVPTLAIGSLQSIKGLPLIRTDNAQGVHLALEHLVTLGHRRIAFFKGHKGSADTEERWKGVQRVAAELGVKIDPKLAIQLKRADTSSSLGIQEGYIAAQALLSTQLEFTALFAFNDMSAIGASNAFRDAGLRLPEDVSVVGFDDIQVASVVYPPLTTVRQPLREMGELAARNIVDQIEGKRRLKMKTTLSLELVVRKSTARVKTISQSNH